MSTRPRAGIRFTSCRSSAFDPIFYDRLDDGTWHRIERTMKGERTCPSGLFLKDWNKATHRQKTLVRSLDRLLDLHPYLDVGLFDGIYSQISRDSQDTLEATGTLLMVVTPEPWQREGVASRNCSIDWLNASQAETSSQIKKQTDVMVNDLAFYSEILEIRTFGVELENGGLFELAWEIPTPAQLATA